MAIKREIKWAVAADGAVTPTTPLDGGAQGDHNQVWAIFEVAEGSAWADPANAVYIECVDGAGNVDTTEQLSVVDGQVAYLIPRAWTQYGGTVTLRLVAEGPGVGDVQAYTSEALARLDSRQNAMDKVDSLLKGRMATMEKRANDALSGAEAAQEAAQESVEQAEQYARSCYNNSYAAKQYAQKAEDAANAAGNVANAAEKAADDAGQALVSCSNHSLRAESAATQCGQYATAAEAAAKRAEAAGGGGGIILDDVKPFRFTVTENKGRYTASKTYEEITEVLTAGNRIVICEYNELELTFAGFYVGCILFYNCIYDKQVYIQINEWNGVDVTRTVVYLTTVNVRDYGAVGNGVEDDTDAIQEALYEAEALGVPLYIPAGTYKVSSTITTHTRDTDADEQSKVLNIYGDGMNTVFTTTEDFDGDYVFYVDIKNEQPRSLWVHDFAIELYADVSGIYFHEIGMKAVVENLWIHHKLKTHAAVRTGIYCNSATVATYQRIKVFGPVPYTDDCMCAGLTLRGHSVKIIDCDVIFCKWGIYLSGGSNWTIDNCRIDENGYGVYQNSSNNILQDDNAYKFTGSFKNLTIKGNRFEHNRIYGIALVSYGSGYLCNNNVTICNNYFTGLGPEEEDGETKYRRAMYFGRCDGVAINENYFNGASEGDQNQNINVATNIYNLSLRGNVASLHTDETQSYAGVGYGLTKSCFVDNIEITQYYENATVTVRGDRIQFADTSGTVDASHTNVVTLGDGVEVTNFTANFDNTRYSQEVTLIAEGATATVKNNGVIKLAGGEDFVMGQWDTITLVRVYVYPLGTKWVEKSRSVNRAT